MNQTPRPIDELTCIPFQTHSRESLVVKNIVESYNIIPLPHIVELDQRCECLFEAAIPSEILTLM